jgi:hypothetical protein
MATRPLASCRRGTYIRNSRVSSTLYDTGAGRPDWQAASSWPAAAASSSADVLLQAEEWPEQPEQGGTHTHVWSSGWGVQQRPSRGV